MAVRPNRQKPYDANSAIFTITKKSVTRSLKNAIATFSCHSQELTSLLYDCSRYAITIMALGDSGAPRDA